MENKNQYREFGFRDKFSYMMGDIGNDLMFFLSSMFLLKFYTDVMGVSAALVGTMMMVSRFVDAFTDVTMGQIVDRAEVKEKGKFAPWIRLVAGPVCVASFLMYATWFRNMPMGFKVFWMFFTYLLWGSVFYTAINIPYGSMASAITGNPKERAELSNWRTIGAQIGITIVGVILPKVVYYTNSTGQTVLSGRAVTIAAAVLSILSFIAFMICYSMTTERVKFHTKKEKFRIDELLKSLFTNRALIGIVVSSLLLLLAQMSFQNMQTYIYPNYFGNTTALSLTNLLQTIITLVCATFVVALSDRFGRKNLAIASAILQAICFFILFGIKTTNVWIFIAITQVAAIGAAIFGLISWAMITDVIDDTEVVTGHRSDGTIYSVYSFARKCGQGFSSGLAGFMLSVVGYTAATAFDPKVLKGIYDITCLVPAFSYVALILSLILLYPLGKKRVEANAAELARRQEAKK